MFYFQLFFIFVPLFFKATLIKQMKTIKICSQKTVFWLSDIFSYFIF